MEWYTLRVISGKEKKIRDAIMFDVSMANLGEYIGDILVPSENIVEMKDGKKKVKNLSLCFIKAINVTPIKMIKAKVIVTMICDVKV